MNQANTGRASRRAGIVALLLWAGAPVSPAIVGAQAPQSQARPDLDGIWDRKGCVPNGVTCPFDVAALPLRARAIGFREAFDEVLSPKYDCVPATIPSLIADPYRFQITQMGDRVLITYEKDDIVRTAWLRGHGHPLPRVGDFYQQGYSEGWYENGQLVIETTRFTFDPHGLDDMSNLPSSTQKKVTERYWREGEGMRADVVMEDPLFLTAPIRMTDAFARSNQPLVLPYGCDVELARQPLQFLPPKYLEPGFVRIPVTPHGEAPR